MAHQEDLVELDEFATDSHAPTNNNINNNGNAASATLKARAEYIQNAVLLLPEKPTLVERVRSRISDAVFLLVRVDRLRESMAQGDGSNVLYLASCLIARSRARMAYRARITERGRLGNRSSTDVVVCRGTAHGVRVLHLSRRQWSIVVS